MRLPYWMTTRLGRWLATHWPPAVALWQASMDRALLDDAEEELRHCRDNLLLPALSAWALECGDAELTDQLMLAWINWRNAAEHLHRLRERMVGHALEVPLELRTP